MPGGWRNGRRASFRSWYRKVWRFKSSPAHNTNKVVYLKREISLVAELVLPKHRAPVRFRHLAQMKKEKIFFISFAVLILFIYGQSLAGGFVFDDRGIGEHKELLSSIDNILRVAVFPYWTIEAGLYRPATLLSYLLNIVFLGEGAFGFHLVNLALYFGIIASAYVLVKRLFKSEWLAYLSALIFLVLPIHTEVVANITGRSELLSLLFSLLALLEFTRDKTNWWRAGLWMLIAIGAKETAVAAIPLALLVIFINKESFKKHWVGLASLFGGAAIYFLLRLIVLGPEHFLGVQTSIIENPLLFESVSGRVATAFSILWMYVSKTFWPANLCSDYSYNQIPIASFASAGAILGALVLLAAIISLFFFLRRRPIISFASAIFIASFLPVSNLLFPVGTIAGERLFFFPSLGFAILLAVILSKIKSKWLALALLIPYIILSFNRQSVWMSEEKLFLNAAQCAPKSVLSLSNLGTVYYFRGEYGKAQEALEASKTIKSVYSKGLNNLGLVYWKQGRFSEAESQYHEALKQKYPYPGAIENMFLLKMAQGDREGALRWLRIVYPNVADSALRNLF